MDVPTWVAFAACILNTVTNEFTADTRGRVYHIRPETIAAIERIDPSTKGISCVMVTNHGGRHRFVVGTVEQVKAKLTGR